MLSGIRRAAMGDASDIDRIAQQVVQCAPAIAQPSPPLATARRPDLADNPVQFEVGLESANSPELDIPLEQIPDRLCFGFIDDKLPVLDVVAQRQVAARPHALALGGRELLGDRDERSTLSIE